MARAKVVGTGANFPNASAIIDNDKQHILKSLESDESQKFGKLWFGDVCLFPPSLRDALSLDNLGIGAPHGHVELTGQTLQDVQTEYRRVFSSLGRCV